MTVCFVFSRRPPAFDQCSAASRTELPRSRRSFPETRALCRAGTETDSRGRVANSGDAAPANYDRLFCFVPLLLSRGPLYRSRNIQTAVQTVSSFSVPSFFFLFVPQDDCNITHFFIIRKYLFNLFIISFSYYKKTTWDREAPAVTARPGQCGMMG